MIVNKQEIEIDYATKKKIETVCSFCNIVPKFYKGSVRSIEKTNLAYLEPHRAIIDGKMYLFFNKSEYVFIGNLNHKIKIYELESCIKSKKIL